MGIFGLFSKDTAAAVRKHAARAGNRRAQAPDRWESIHALARIGTEEAIEGLLPRFTFYVEPSITDQEEKDAAFDAVVKAGDAAVVPVQRFLRRSESISWPLKMLDRLLPTEGVVGELLTVLGEMDTEYERDPQRKIQLLAALEERRDPRIAETVARFLEDVNETARFHAAGALLAQESPSAVQEALGRALATEESLRVRARILDGFAERQWPLGSALEPAKRGLPAGFAIGNNGVPKRV